MNKRVGLIVVLLALLVQGLSVAARATMLPERGKVVAVVYDDSSSMVTAGDHRRWVRANYALKVMASLLQPDDKLIVVRMSRPERGEVYEGVGGFNRAVDTLNKQFSPRAKTPYEALETAVAALEKQKSEGKKLWLVVISDGGFNELVQTKVASDVRSARSAGVNAVFIPINPDSKGLQVAEIWKNEINASIEVATDGPEVVDKIARVAALLNGQSDRSMEVKLADREVDIEAAFPLRGVTLLRQDSDAAKLEDIQWAQQALSVSKLREHEFPPNQRISDMPDRARIVHIRQADNRVLAVGQKLKLRFGQDVTKLTLTYLPDVAANYSVEIQDAAKRPLQKDANGRYLVCDSQYYVAVALTDDTGKTLLANRTDANRFKVTARIDGKDHDFVSGSFDQRFNVGPWNSEAVISATMEYPGYLYRQSKPLTLAFGGDQCRKIITMKVQSGLDGGGNWRAAVDSVEQAPFVRVAVFANDQPATLDELQNWSLNAGVAANALEIRYVDGALLLRPKTDCCLWWWKNPGPGEYSSTLNLTTPYPQDEIRGAPSMRFVVEPPTSLWGMIRWYGCPFALLALIVSMLWYLQRLLRKARFGPDSRLETEENPKVDGEGIVRPHTFLLREESNALKRWLWPSKAEVATIRGLRFHAMRQGDLEVDGRDLQAKHAIPGWVFDRSRTKSERARDRQQENACLSDNVVMKIDEGVCTVTMRYKA